MAYTTVHMVRHGQVDNPQHLLYERLPGFHLSAKGRRMARATADYMASQPDMASAVAIFSSPLERTRETAQQILEAINHSRDEGDKLVLQTDRRIIEAGNNFRGTRIGHGDGALWRRGNWRLVLNLWKPSWGESYRSIARRVGQFVYEKVDQYPGQNLIVVSHESPIWSFRHLLETGHAEHNMLLRHTDLASVTSFTFETGSHELVNISYASPAAQAD